MILMGRYENVLNPIGSKIGSQLILRKRQKLLPRISLNFNEVLRFMTRSGVQNHK